MAVLGAHRCRRHYSGKLPDDCGTYLATAHGSFTDTVRLLEDQVQRHLPITPFRFVNVLSNIAGFHVAAHLGTSGENLAIARLKGAFDAALETAAMDLALGQTDCAMVGGVDEGDDDLALHRSRTKTPEGRIPGEGSGWLLLTADLHQEGALLQHGGDYGDPSVLADALHDARPDCLAVGTSADRHPASLQAAFPNYAVWDYHQTQGWILSNPAMAFAEHICNGAGRLAHIDQTGPQGQWRLWLLDR
nr:beta-ketoacyl synthase N-terminal-like domain-containing protein [Natronospira proteinivora]